MEALQQRILTKLEGNIVGSLTLNKQDLMDTNMVFGQDFQSQRNTETIIFYGLILATVVGFQIGYAIGDIRVPLVASIGAFVVLAVVRQLKLTSF